MNVKKGISTVLLTAILLNALGMQGSFAADAAAEVIQETEISEFGQSEEVGLPESSAGILPESGEDITVTESEAAEEPDETQIPETSEAPLLHEAAEDAIEIGEMPVYQDGSQYSVITLGDGDCLITGIASRSLEVYVTDGYNPIPNAQITICG